MANRNLTQDLDTALGPGRFVHETHDRSVVADTALEAPAKPHGFIGRVMPRHGTATEVLQHAEGSSRRSVAKPRQNLGTKRWTGSDTGIRRHRPERAPVAASVPG